MNYRNSRENRMHSSVQKPFSYYSCVIPDQFTCAPMHWHSEFEINYVWEGASNLPAAKKNLFHRLEMSFLCSPM